jgi:lipoprotein-anchoring transpeptidase ErfK/SrfK
MRLLAPWRLRLPKVASRPLIALALLGLTCSVDVAMPGPSAGARAPAPVPALRPGASPEERLIHTYRLIGAGRSREALAVAEQLVRDEPTFRLAHLVYADLLTVRQMGVAGFGGGVEKALPGADRRQLDPLRSEALVRLQALREDPPKGTVPRQLVSLPATVPHAIAVDASRSRLYLLERRANGLQLVADYYVSLGKYGIDKRAEGDQRTPTGAYFITSRHEDGRLDDFYGSGALPLNYPNEFDRREGRKGHGIWLHGVPRTNYAREPLATDGCIVLANEDLQALMRQVDSGGTPVVIAPSLDWVAPAALDAARREAIGLVRAWHRARMSGDSKAVRGFYLSPSVAVASSPSRRGSSRRERREEGQLTEIKDVSVLRWSDGKDLMIATFGEVPTGETSGSVIRQYWSRETGGWKIFSETVLY